MSQVEQIISNLYKWMQDRKFNVETQTKLKLINSPNPYEGRCVVASESIKYEEVIGEFPIDFLINYRFALEKQDLKCFFEWCCESEKLNRLDALHLFLIDELIDVNSNFYAFVVSMPQTYDSPEYFDNTLIELLPEYLRVIVNGRRKLLHEKYLKLKQLIAKFSLETSKLKNLLENFNYEIYRWSFCSVNTRCFHFDEENVSSLDFYYVNKLFGSLNRNLDKNTQSEQVYEVNNSLCCLIPCLDFMNHSHNSNAYGEFDQETNKFTLKAVEKRDDSSDCEIAIGKNEQIYVQYGSHDNRTLFIEYGFVLQDNCYDFFAFDKEDLIQILNDTSKISYFWSLMNDAKIYVSDLNCNNEGPSWSLLKTLDLICHLNDKSNENDTKRAKKIKYNDVSSITYFQAIRDLYEKLLLKYSDQLNEALQRFNLMDKSFYHVSVSFNLCQLQFEIIKKNLSLVCSDDEWQLLF